MLAISFYIIIELSIISYLSNLIANYHTLKRLITILLLCIGNALMAQPPKLSSYAERYYYIDSLKYTIVKMPYRGRIDTLTVLANQAEETDDKELAGKLRLLLLNTEIHETSTDKAAIEKKYSGVIQYAIDNSLPYLQADALEGTANYHLEFNRQESEALENYVAAYKIYSKFSPDQFPAKQEYIASLGGMYYRYEDFDNALKYLREAIATKGTKRGNMYLTLSNTIGMSFRRTKQYDSAIWYFRHVYDSASKAENQYSTWAHIAGGNIGITYFLQGKYDEAIPLLDEDIKVSLASNQIKNAAGSMSTRAAIYYYKGDYNNAEKILLQALRLCESKPFWPSYGLGVELYGWLYKVYAAKNDMRKAYLYADSTILAKDSLAAMQNTINLAKANEKLSHIQRKLDEEKLNDRIKQDQLALSKKRIQVAFFFAGIIVLLLVVIFIARERRRTENILLNILPEKIADRLKKREHPIADYFENASILFIDMAGFTSFSDGRDPKEVVTTLNNVFTNFDMLADQYGLEKIKTIGDCYMAVSGLPEPNPRHAEAAVEMALAIKNEMGKYKASDGTPITFRMGLDCGPVVAGVIGRRKFIYDLWGDTVNTASRMETTGIAGEIHCSDRFKRQLEGHYNFKSRGTIEIKGKGHMETWLIV